MAVVSVSQYSSFDMVPLPSATALAHGTGRVGPRLGNRQTHSCHRAGSRFRLMLAARLLELAQLGRGVLDEAGVAVHRLVVLIPADILPAMLEPTRIYGAFAIAAEKLAGVEVLLDHLLALARHFDDMPLLELPYGEAEKLREPPAVLAADLYIPSHPAAPAPAFS